MSTLLYHLNINRTVDDDSHQINLLFPKCKPRVTSAEPSTDCSSNGSNSAFNFKDDSNANRKLNKHIGQHKTSRSVNLNQCKVSPAVRGGRCKNRLSNSESLAQVESKRESSPSYYAKNEKIKHTELRSYLVSEEKCRRKSVNTQRTSTVTFGTPALVTTEPCFVAPIDIISERKLGVWSGGICEFSDSKKDRFEGLEESMDFDALIVGKTVSGSDSSGKVCSELNASEGSSLRDSRIEMAGGREVFSQNKTRVGRRVKGGSSFHSEYQPDVPTLLPSSSGVLQALNRTDKSPAGYTNQACYSQSDLDKGSIWESNPFPTASVSRDKQNRASLNKFSLSCDHEHSRGIPEYTSAKMSRRSGDRSALNENTLVINNSLIPLVHSAGMGIRLKETVFGSEITCVEKCVSDQKRISAVDRESGGSSSKCGNTKALAPSTSCIYESSFRTEGEIVFDDIGDWREDSEVESEGALNSFDNYPRDGEYRNDLIQTRDLRLWESNAIRFMDKRPKYKDDEQAVFGLKISEQGQLPNRNTYGFDELVSKPECRRQVSSSETSQLIGNLQIAEYEGSPKRYGLNRQPTVTVSLPTDLDLVDMAHGPLNVEAPAAPSSLSLDVENKIISSLSSPSDYSQHTGTDTVTPAASALYTGIQRLPGFPQRVGATNPFIYGNEFGEDLAAAKIRNHDLQSEPDRLGADKQYSATSDLNSNRCEETNDGLVSLALRSETATPPATNKLNIHDSLDEGVGSSDGLMNSDYTKLNNAQKELEQRVSEVIPEGDHCGLLFEFSETRKVLEDFFKGSPYLPQEITQTFSELDYTLKRQSGNSYVGQRLAGEVSIPEESPKKPRHGGREVVMSLGIQDVANAFEVDGDSPKLISFHDVSQNSSLSPTSRRSPDTKNLAENEGDVETVSTDTETDLRDIEGLQVGNNFTPSLETTDCDSNDLESEISLDYETSLHSSSRVGPAMPVLEDGLSSGRESDNEEEGSGKYESGKYGSTQKLICLTENSCNSVNSGELIANPTLVLMKKQISEIEKEIKLRATTTQHNTPQMNGSACVTSSPASDHTSRLFSPTLLQEERVGVGALNRSMSYKSRDAHEDGIPCLFDSRYPELEALDPMRPTPPPSPAPVAAASHEGPDGNPFRHDIKFAVNMNKNHVKPDARISELEIEESANFNSNVAAALKDIKDAIQRTKMHNHKNGSSTKTGVLPSGQERQHSEPHGVHQLNSLVECSASGNPSPVWVPRQTSIEEAYHRIEDDGSNPLVIKSPYDAIDEDADTDQETDRLLGQHRTEEDCGFYDDKEIVKKKRNKEDFLKNPSVLIEGVLFRARYLGSTQLVCEGQPTKATRMLQAEEAVSRIKSTASEGEPQPSTEVDLFISTEKIMVLNTDLKEIMMDHALRTISYIADIGDLVVLMARRRPVPSDLPEEPTMIPRPPKMICHVFESDEAQYIAQSIGQAFQVAYMEFLKANGIEDHSFVREMDYQEVLNSQEIFGDELRMFAKKELQKDVVVPKGKSEILGVVIVESGWGSMLPTVVIANLSPTGAAARCGHLNIGDQIIAINGVSLVGLPLSTCQAYIKNSKNQTVVKLTVVPCPPVVEVKIKRPDTKYQLGFSVQNGVICSLLRGGIAERGGVRVGHRIIEINNQSVVAVPHEKIVNLLATSVGEINMKTMPTSMFRLLTGQETPLFI